MTDYLINYRRTRHPGYIPGIQPPIWSLLPTTNLEFHIEAGTLILNDNDLVQTWTETIAGNSPTQAVEAQRPVFKTSIINGLPIVRFNGASNTELVAPGHGIAVFGESSYYCVVQFGASVVGCIFNEDRFQYYHRGFALRVGLNDGQLGNDILGLYNGVTWIDTNVAYGTSPVLVSFHTNAATTTAYFYKNGNLIYTYNGSAADTGDNGSISIGTANLTGDVAEILAYGVLHDNDTRQLVESYLNDKYSLW